MNKKTLLVVLVIAVAVGCASFYGGMKYGQSKSSNDFIPGNFPNMRNLSQRFPQPNMAGRRDGANFITGEIISKDNKSITVKLPDNGTKIIFYSATTEVGKFMNGTSADLAIGKTVTVNGKTNQDGSFTAQSIQMRPAGLNPPSPPTN